jgi:hypothetical protein
MKLSILSTSGPFPSSMGFFGSIKVSEVDVLSCSIALAFQDRPVASGSTIWNKANPFWKSQSRSIRTTIFGGVGQVLTMGANSQITEPVVPGVSVNVIDNHSIREFSAKHLKDNPVRDKGCYFGVDEQVHVNTGRFLGGPLTSLASSFLTRPSSIRSTLKILVGKVMDGPTLPNQQSSVWIVVETFIKIFSRRQFFSGFHALPAYSF